MGSTLSRVEDVRTNQRLFMSEMEIHLLLLKQFLNSEVHFLLISSFFIVVANQMRIRVPSIYYK